MLFSFLSLIPVYNFVLLMYVVYSMFVKFVFVVVCVSEEYA